MNDTDPLTERLARYEEEWLPHPADDERTAGLGHHMSQMLYRLPRDGQTDDMRKSIESMLADLRDLAARVVDARAELVAEEVHRDLTRRLGFGDNITEPMADNDTIVAWVEGLDMDASEWRESQRWRDDCYAAGHPDDEDCWEHDPTLRAVAAAHADALAPVLALADRTEAAGFRAVYTAEVRAAVAVPEPEPTEGDTP